MINLFCVLTRCGLVSRSSYSLRKVTTTRRLWRKCRTTQWGIKCSIYLLGTGSLFVSVTLWAMPTAWFIPLFRASQSENVTQHISLYVRGFGCYSQQPHHTDIVTKAAHVAMRFTYVLCFESRGFAHYQIEFYLLAIITANKKLHFSTNVRWHSKISIKNKPFIQSFTKYVLFKSWLLRYQLNRESWTSSLCKAAPLRE